MKKLIAITLLMVCVLSYGHTQPFIVDDAVKGTGVHQHRYFGTGWIYGKTTTTFYNSTHSASTRNGAYLTFTFYGNGIEWFTERKNTHGIVVLSIDGGVEVTIDLYSSTEQHMVVFRAYELPLGTHTIKIRSTGTKNPAATNYYIIHDYFRVIVGPPITEPETDNTSTFAGTGSGAYPIIGIPPFDNTGFGYQTLMNNSGMAAGKRNTAVGSGALENSGASSNTAIGFKALGQAPLGGGNTAVGALALHTYGDGRNPLSVHGNFNTAIGYFSGPAIGVQNFTNTTSLGAEARVTASNQVRIGNANVTSIGGQVSWSTLSDGRFKKDLREDISGLEFINNLRPVSYNIDNTAFRRFLGIPDSLDDSKDSEREKHIRHTGFVAQEVDKLVKKSGYVFNGVDAPQNKNDAYTIRYAEFVVPLVKAVQEMSMKLDDQQQQITELLAQIAEKENDGSKSKTELMLFQNNPNPFSVDTEIKMTLPETTASARVIVYNLEGKQLKEVTVKERGSASVKIMANELGAGMYIYALIVDGKVVDTKRMILTK